MLPDMAVWLIGWLMDWLIVFSCFESYHRPSGLFLQSRKLSEVYAFDRLPSKRWCPLQCLPVFQFKPKCYECSPNSTVWQEPRKTAATGTRQATEWGQRAQHIKQDVMLEVTSAWYSLFVVTDGHSWSTMVILYLEHGNPGGSRQMLLHLIDWFCTL